MRIVTGCMRSGTSFVCNLLERLGGNLGDVSDHVPADKWNAKGYYETRKINLLNNELMFGRWGDPAIWVDQMWPDDIIVKLRKNMTLAIAPWATRARAIEKRAFQNADQIQAICDEFSEVIIKDPRFSYVMAEWEKYGQIERVLYCVRHPWEAAYSMKRQTGLPVFLTYMGWNDAVERFWKNPPNAPITILNYNNFFEKETAEQEMIRLFDFLEKEYDQAEARRVLDSVYDPKMRSGVASEMRLPVKTRNLYEGVLSKIT